MTPEERSRMTQLCAQIQSEKDFTKFQELTREVTKLISAKKGRFPESRFAPKGSCHRIVQAKATRTMKSIESDVEVVEIKFSDAQPLYSEIRIENSFIDEYGQRLALEPPTDMEVKFHVAHGCSVKS